MELLVAIARKIIQNTVYSHISFASVLSELIDGIHWDRPRQARRYQFWLSRLLITARRKIVCFNLMIRYDWGQPWLSEISQDILFERFRWNETFFVEIEIHIFICRLSKVNDQFIVSVSKSKLSFINSISRSLWLLHKKALDKNSKVLLTMNNELK